MDYFDKHLTIKLLYFQQFSDSKIASPLRCNRVAVTVQSRCRYGAIAMPLRCNRDAVTVQSQRHYTVIAKILGKNPAGGVVEGQKATLFLLYLPLFPSVKFWQ